MIFIKRVIREDLHQKEVGAVHGTVRVNNLYNAPVRGIWGLRSVENFLKTAMEPVGYTLYVLGGGWNPRDTGAGPQTRRLGISKSWIRFFNEQDKDYSYRDYCPNNGINEYYYGGLDCSGYLGWVLYNTLERERGKDGYVCSALRMAKSLSERGWGMWTKDINGLRAGDVVSIKGHVWISLGRCADSSVVILHSTPSRGRQGGEGGGVQIGAVGKDNNCEAMYLSKRYMQLYYPRWYSRYEGELKNPDVYFDFSTDDAGLFSWTTEGGVLSDSEGIQKMRPRELLERLFSFSYE